MSFFRRDLLFGVVPQQAHVSAQGNRGDAIFRPTDLARNQFGPKSQREGEYPNARQPRNDEMTELVNEDQDAQYHEEGQDRSNHSNHSSPVDAKIAGQVLTLEIGEAAPLPANDDSQAGGEYLCLINSSARSRAHRSAAWKSSRELGVIGRWASSVL